MFPYLLSACFRPLPPAGLPPLLKDTSQIASFYSWQRDFIFSFKQELSAGHWDKICKAEIFVQ